MAFNLIQLETFCRLAQKENFSRTAEALNLTQPAVTQHVRALQEHFGVKLVDAGGRRTQLTDAGRFLAARAEELLGNVAALEREMREFADASAGELRIGATVTIGSYSLPGIVARFRRTHPGVATRIEIANTATIARSLRAGAVSVALVEGALAGEDLDIAPFADDELILIAPRGHALATRARPLRPAELAGLPMIVRERGSGTREQVERIFASAGVDPDEVLTLSTGDAIVRAVELAIGLAFISRVVAEDAIALGRVERIAIAGPAFDRTFRVVTLRGRTRSPAAVAFIGALIENHSGDPQPTSR